MRLLKIFIYILFILVTSNAWSAEPGVHYFDCKECHLSGLSLTMLGNGNVCLSCHNPTAGDIALNADAPAALDGHTDHRFASIDASNAFGNGASGPSAYQTSHTWAAPSDNSPAAGAQAPDGSTHPEFYSRYGASGSRITCSRCHNPHAPAETNPKLLVKGAGSTDDMCLACHAPWDQADNHGWLTHPIIDDYNASVLSEPDKFNASLSNKGNASIQLVNGGVSCTSCHGIHFVDSDSSTVDGPTQTLNKSDGKLLRGDGALRADKSSLCQTCHSYREHGNNSGEKVGCLVCHSGHSYDPGLPNYYVLRKTVNSATFGARSGLDYSSTGVLNPAVVYTFWQDRNDGTAEGYCEKCHGDAAALAGSFHNSAAVCTDCHKHNAGSSGSFGHGDGSSGDCTVCHTAVHEVDKTQADWMTFFAPGSDHSFDAGYKVDTYATCTLCHATNLLPIHTENCAVCHFGASPPRESFTDWNLGCQQGSCHETYHPNASPGHNDEYNLNNCTTNCHVTPYREGWLHDFSWDKIARSDFCGECHILPADTNPPVSKSDVQTNYIDDAVITLTAFDPWGIQAIYYQLDGGTTQTYAGSITVSAPTDAPQDHTLVFWARDTSGNTESPQSEDFTISKDTVPPVTTSDARAYYGADATINLTATDNATSMPVATTYYVFDDPGGTPVAGTTAVFPEPASSPENHTIYFWSVDHAGNVEAQNHFDFTMISNGLEYERMTGASWVSGYSDPYSNPDRIYADPWISYQVYVDGAPIGGPVTTQYDLWYNSYYGLIYPKMPQTWASTWRCPSGIAVDGNSQIDIVINAGFNDRELWSPASELPVTYTIPMPDEAVQLEPADWSFSIDLDWKAFDYLMEWHPYDGHSLLTILPSVENIAYVTTIPDITDPVTASNITSGGIYAGNQTFTLTPTDADRSGVEGTWWQLDGTGGAWTQGTSVTVNAPAAGTAAHTLYWYSVDYAGNQETIQSVSFNVEALGTSVLTLPLDTEVYLHADMQGLDTPWLRYNIYVDDVFKGSLYKNRYSSVTTWGLTQTIVSTGSHIDIVVHAGYTEEYTGGVYTNAPYTFTLNLPAGVRRLENASWGGFPNVSWGWDYDEVWDWPYDYVSMPTGTIGNIVYAGGGADITPPVTSIDAVGGATYNGDQTFTLTPTDGGSGVESTWWQLDGSGVWNIGTSVPVAAPTAGNISHTITWYSRDNDANQEATNAITFDMQP